MLVTSHDAFGYFGRAYGFEVRGLQGVSTASEAGTQGRRTDWPSFLGERRIPAVFTETSVAGQGAPGGARRGAKSYGHAVRLVGGDDAPVLGRARHPGTPGGTYAGMVRHNVTVIVEALK